MYTHTHTHAHLNKYTHTAGHLKAELKPCLLLPFVAAIQAVLTLVYFIWIVKKLYRQSLSNI